MPSGKQNAALAISILTACTATVAGTMTAEGWSNKPYKDTNGVWTVCNGETLNINPNHYYTDQECLSIFLVSLVDKGSQIAKCLPPVVPPGSPDIPGGMRSEFTDLSYNFGASGFCHSAIAKKAQAHDYVGSCKAISLYVYSNHKDCRIRSNNCYGIVTRRIKSQCHCMKAIDPNYTCEDKLL